MFQLDRTIFRELCTVKFNLKINAVFIKYYGRLTDMEQADDNHNKQQVHIIILY
jgi:hypothetical protein